MSREINSFIKRVRIWGWIALLATLCLVVEIWLLLESLWGVLDTNTQLIIFLATLIIVISLGYRTTGPGAFVKRK